MQKSQRRQHFVTFSAVSKRKILEWQKGILMGCTLKINN